MGALRGGRWVVFVAVAAGLLTAATWAHAEWYKVSVTRKADNLYKVEDTYPAVWIETRFCFEFAFREPAVLRYERFSYDNRLVFDNGTACDVVRVF